MAITVDALQSAVSGLNVAQQLLNITAQNASNAQTTGYTRKTIQIGDQVAGGEVVGTVIGNVQRTVDTGLQKTYWSQVSNSGQLSTINTALGTLQSLYGTANAQTSFSSYLSDLNNDFASLSATPDSSSEQQQTVSDAQTFASSLNATAAAITTQRNSAETAIGTTVDSINTNLQTIASLNNDIAQANYAGQSTAALADQRDTAVTSLAQQMGISYYTNSSGVMVVQDTNGDVLADTTAHTLVFSTQSVGDRSSYPTTLSGVYIDSSSTGVDLAAKPATVGGTLGGLLALRDQILPTAQAQLDQVALQTANRFNAQGLTLFTNPDGTIPSSVGTAAVGFSSTITVNPAVTANPALVQQGTPTTPPSPALDPGDNTIIDKVLNYTFGTNSDASGTPNTPFTTSGLGMNGDISLTGVSATNTLEGFAQQVLTQQASQSSNYTAQQTASDNYRDSVQQSLSNSDGVDLDTEVSNLTVYEHSYAASAQVITTVNQMMTDLFNAISSVSTG